MYIYVHVNMYRRLAILDLSCCASTIHTCAVVHANPKESLSLKISYYLNNLHTCTALVYTAVCKQHPPLFTFTSR